MENGNGMENGNSFSGEQYQVSFSWILGKFTFSGPKTHFFQISLPEYNIAVTIRDPSSQYKEGGGGVWEVLLVTFLVR